MQVDIHSIHPYPCKFPPQSVIADLEPGKVFLDPFCGSGTAVLEARRSGMSAWGIDCNPIATLISRVKVAHLSDRTNEKLDSMVERLAATDVETSGRELHNFAGRDHWFSCGSQTGIAAILGELTLIADDETAWDVGAVALSAIVNRVSNQDSETRYARVPRIFSATDVVRIFLEKLAQVRNALEGRGALPPGDVGVITADLLTGVEIPSNSVDVVFTSPPYANTMDYYLYHKQRMNILGYDFKQTQAHEIGSRHEFSSRKSPVDKWADEYASALSQIRMLLKPEGRAFVVIGDSQIAGKLVDAFQLTQRLASDLDFKVQLIASEEMAGRSRTFNAKFQRPNKREHVILLEG